MSTVAGPASSGAGQISGNTSSSGGGASASSSSSSSIRVGEIFTSAGAAFNQLGELTAQLSSVQHQAGSGAAKWTDEEVELLHEAITTFADSLRVISERIKGRAVGQIKTALKKKAFEDAGLPASASAAAVTGQSQQEPQSILREQPTAIMAKPSADVTLNMLNATSESEVDVEGLGESRLHFEGSGADVKL